MSRIIPQVQLDAPRSRVDEIDKFGNSNFDGVEIQCL